jgi:hypothetical protein
MPFWDLLPGSDLLISRTAARSPATENTFHPAWPAAQHFRRFLPNGQQNLHLTLVEKSDFYLGFAYIRIGP